jgi:hypothetical protein
LLEEDGYDLNWEVQVNGNRQRICVADYILSFSTLLCSNHNIDDGEYMSCDEISEERAQATGVPTPVESPSR